MSTESGVNFIEAIINQDIKSNKHQGRVVTRFPPEPNGYLHVGHAKSICLNFGLAKQYHGICHLRFDDTNPEKEDEEYVQSIMRDIRWLGFDWSDKLFYASDYFEKLYDFAVQLIKMGKAYVCDLSADDIRKTRGTLTEPGKESPYRNRSIKENLDLFQAMRDGKFKDGEKVLRAKIDMTSPNINMRDPAIFRIRHAHHQRTGNKWCIYPLYDFTHCLSDMLENITHSICTLEFEDHRPLYDWCLETLKTPCHPQQIEFARLNVEYMITSKRRLTQLVNDGHVTGWDDPRMSTLAGMRRRGYTPQSIRNFCQLIGVGKKNTIISFDIFEECVRQDLNETALRAFVVLDPIKVVLTNFPDGHVENLEVPNHPQKPEWGKRALPFSKTLFIDRSDFQEHPEPGFVRLTPGGSVRLRYAYVIRCQNVVKDTSGQITELHCTYEKDTLGGKSIPGMKKVKGIIHWVGAHHAFHAEVRLYNKLFTHPTPADTDQEFVDLINPYSLQIAAKAVLEPSLKSAKPESHFQFERLGYFYVDPKDSTTGKPVFNRTVTLRDDFQPHKKVSFRCHSSC